jgi:MFS transporter, ACS family, hexuronate transporter
MLSRPVAWSMAIAATLTMTVSYFDRATLNILAPAVTAELGVSDTAYGWLSAAFSIAYLIATPLAGWWIDGFGARRGLLISVVVWSLIAAAHALVPGVAALFALRIALGLAEGPSFPGATQTIARTIPPGSRARAFGLLFTGSSVGAMLAPLAASWFYEHGGWRLAFVGTAALGMLWVPIWLALTHRREVRAHLDRRPEEQARSLGRRAALRLAATPALVCAMIAVFAVTPAIGFVGMWAAKFLVHAFGVAQGDLGDYLWLPALAFDGGALLFGDLAARGRIPLRALFVLAAVLAIALAALPWAASPWAAVGIAGVAMVGNGGMFTLITAHALQQIEADRVSLAGGILAGGQSLALIASGPLIGWARERLGGYDEIAIALVCWLVPGVVVWLTAARNVTGPQR